MKQVGNQGLLLTDGASLALSLELELLLNELIIGSFSHLDWKVIYDKVSPLLVDNRQHNKDNA